MEEQQKNNKTAKVILIVLLLIGIGLLVTGIVTAVKYSADYKSWEEAWWNGNAEMWESPTAYFLAFLIPGIFLTILSTGLIISVSLVKNIKPVLYDNKDEGTQGSFGFINKLKTPQKRVCKYCGSENSIEATKCSSCGASLSNKK